MGTKNKIKQKFLIDRSDIFLTVKTPFSIIGDSLKGTMISQVILYHSTETKQVEVSIDHIDYDSLTYRGQSITLDKFKEICKLHKELGQYTDAEEDNQVDKILNKEVIKKLIKKFPVEEIVIDLCNE